MLPNFSLRQLGYLVAVADLGSMTAAAESEHVSQAAISAGINDLERRLGVRLLTRRPGHGASLTEAGIDVLSDARKVLDSASDLMSQVRAPASDLRGSLALGCYTTMAPLYLPALYHAFGIDHPGLELTVMEGAQEDLRRSLMSGATEIALAYDNGLGTGLAMETIRTVRPYILLAASHALAEQESVGLHDLAGEPLIQFSLLPSPSNIDKLLHHAGVKPKIVHSSPNIEVVRSLVARGLGYSPLLQRWPVDVSLEGLPLVCVPLDTTVPDYRVVVAWPEKSHLSRRAASVIAFLRHHSTEDPLRTRGDRPPAHES